MTRAIDNPCISEDRVDYLTHTAAAALGTGIERLRCKGMRRVSRTRWLVAWFLWDNGASKSQIARALNQDRSTVLSALRSVEQILKSSEQHWWRDAIERMRHAPGTVVEIAPSRLERSWLREKAA